MELFNGHGWRITLDDFLLPEGEKISLPQAHRCDSVHILALPTEETVLLLREFRPTEGQHVWMLPSGRMDKADESEPLAAAQRELREETGFRANDITHYFTTRHSVMLVSNNHVFLARDLIRDPLPMEAHERIETLELPIGEAIDKVFEGPFIHATSGAALLKYQYEKMRLSEAKK